MVGPLRPSGNLLPVLQLAPFNMVGIDFMGPIVPVTEGTQRRYVIVMVDYFTGYC